ncbi:MAG: hypothetical protein CMJ16_02315 [Peredibacter sp.]|nr:hypothetical protein [Peredibacter sp.]
MKRSRYKIMGPANYALKNMRNARGVSIRKLAKMMGVKEAKVNHYENGRVEKVSEEYLQRFLEALNYSDEDWTDFLNGKTTIFDLEQRCCEMIKSLEKKKLKAVHAMLEGFV